MNEKRAAEALNTISLGFAELAEALGAEQPGSVAASQTKAGSPSAATPAGSPVPAELPPSFDELPPEDMDFRTHALTGPLAEKIEAVPGRVIRAMGDVCPDHDLAWEVVPGGVSKRTGKAYKAFWHCPSLMCKQKPEREWQESHPAGRAA